MFTWYNIGRVRMSDHSYIGRIQLCAADRRRGMPTLDIHATVYFGEAIRVGDRYYIPERPHVLSDVLYMESYASFVTRFGRHSINGCLRAV